MKILLTGGGTGGHIMPIVAVAQELKKQSHLQNKKLELLWVGKKKSQEESAAKKYHVKFHSIACGKLRRYFSFKNFADFFKVPLGIWQAKKIIKDFQPEAIFSKGGYVSAPVLFAARKSKIPIYIHESDSIPGQTNLYFAKYAKKIFITFQECKKLFGEYQNKTVLSGMPLRSEIMHGNKKHGARIFGLEYGKPTILIMGGSQGAKKINDLVLEILPELLKNYQVIHLVGEKNVSEVKSWFQNKSLLPKEESKSSVYSPFSKGGLRGIYYHFFPQLSGERLADALACADLVISRAGANAIFELAALSKPLILIPYPYGAAAHQIKNALIFVKEKAAEILLENQLNSIKFLKRIDAILKDESGRHNQSKNIFEKFGKKSLVAAKKIVNEIFYAARGGG